MCGCLTTWKCQDYMLDWEVEGEIPGEKSLSCGFQGQAGYGSPGWDVACEVSCSFCPFSGCFFPFALFFLLSSGSISLFVCSHHPPARKQTSCIYGGDQSVGSSITILPCFHRSHDLHTSQGGSGGLDAAGTDKGLLPGSKAMAKGLWDVAKNRLPRPA